MLFESFKLYNLLETVTNANAMYTMKTPNADNNSCPPPLQYSILVDSLNEFSLNFHSIVFLSHYILEVFHFLVISTIEYRSSGDRKLVFF